MNKENRSSAIDLLVDWANAQDNWVRAIVSHVLQSRRALSIASVEEIYDLLLHEKGLAAQADTVSVPPLGGDYGPGHPDEPLRLASLSDLKNVNALAPAQHVTFNSRMTVLYGENGAGKSGYVRVLKQLAAVRTREPILPDISCPEATGGPSASIAYALDGTTSDFRWTGEEGVAPFTRIDVFDAHGVDVHVDGELNYVYTPSDLAVFRYTHEALEAVRSRLEIERKNTQPSGNPFLARFSRGGSLYVQIETLGPTTDVAELERRGSVSDEERSQLEPLRERVNALSTGISDTKLRITNNEKLFLNGILGAIQAAYAYDGAGHQHALDEVSSARTAHTQATRQALSAEDIPGVLEDSWRRFIEAGHSYLQEHFGGNYPHERDRCPYCRQDLGDAASRLVSKYQAFCRSDLQKRLDTAQRRVTTLTTPLLALDIDSLAADLENRVRETQDADAPPPSVVASRDALTIIATVQTTVSQGSAVTSSRVRTDLDSCRSQIETRIAELERLADGLRSEVGRRQELLAGETAKLRELEDRIALDALLPDLRRYVELTKWASRAGILLNRFRQVSRSLTNTTKVASEAVLNDDFERAFADECRALRAPAVRLDFPGRRGQPARRKRLTPKHKLSDILSEGEQKVIALADFFAESSLRGSSSPVVLDDPVTSLDYKRLKYVVARLVEFSTTRQVIVFIHNILFTMELLAKFDDDRKSCNYYDITEDGELHGIVSPGQCPRLDTWNDKKARINKLIERVRSESDPEVELILIEKGYDDLRGACEIVVEQTLLRGVVQSYRPNVMVGNLKRVNVAYFTQASSEINDIFDRCCRFTGAHRQPLETLSVRPTLGSLEDDWNALQRIRADAAKSTATPIQSKDISSLPKSRKD
jgi:hypothetical protein